MITFLQTRYDAPAGPALRLGSQHIGNAQQCLKLQSPHRTRTLAAWAKSYARPSADGRIGRM